MSHSIVLLILKRINWYHGKSRDGDVNLAGRQSTWSLRQMKSQWIALKHYRLSDADSFAPHYRPANVVEVAIQRVRQRIWNSVVSRPE
jgi:hypothetical protein